MSNTRPGRKVLYSLGAVVTMVMLIAGVLYSGGNTALAVHGHDFQLDGNITSADSSDPAYDWSNFFDTNGEKLALPSPDFISPDFSKDFVLGAHGPDESTFATGSKDTLPITSGWECTESNNVNDKVDIINAYATGYTDPDGALHIYFGLERFSNDGDANVGFWFLQDPSVDCTPAGGGGTAFTGQHTDGDLLVVTEFTNGGVITTVNVYEWQGGALNPTPVATGQDCDSVDPGDEVCANVNVETVTPPWPSEDKDGDKNLDVSEFFEGGIDLTALLPNTPCFGTYIGETRSSQELTATLFDYALGHIDTCKDIRVIKYHDLNGSGTDNGEPRLPNWTMNLYEDTDGNGGPDGAAIASADTDEQGEVLFESIAPGDYVVCEMLKDGWVNTDPGGGTLCKAVTMTTKEDQVLEFGNGQPDISVEKTGDALSKVGDDAHYTATIENTGDVTLYMQSIEDTLAGDLTNSSTYDASDCGSSLASGASCTIEYTYTVQSGDPDPLLNTVSVTYDTEVGLDGIEVSASDDHSVNLFQPAISVSKDGPELSKVGDDVTYTVTVTNESSDDAPDLVFDSIDDTVVGDLMDSANYDSSDCGASLGYGESCTIEYTYTVPEGAPDPLDNTVTVHAHPDGFPNDITDSAVFSVNLFQPAISVTKGGTALSKVGDAVTYTVTITNESSDDAPDLVFDAVSDSLAGDLRDSANYDSSDCGASLSYGESCTIEYTYTVPEGAPDPLDNTVTVHAHPDGFPNDITDSAVFSVNLFQPAISVSKDGPELSKVGDDVTYTVIVTNESSDDAPDLVFDAVSDSLAGDLRDSANYDSSDCGASLGYGESCTIEYTYTVPEGAPDPLDNTITVHAHPDGFPNDITDSAVFSVNLFQPAISVTKGGTALSKVGDAVTYTVTITNESSDDAPDLVFDAVSDSLAGDLRDSANYDSSDCGASLSYGESCTIEYTYTVPEGAPDPLDNTVTVHAHPDGFPNDIADSADFSVNLFQPAISISKEANNPYSKAGDTIVYTVTISNDSSEDAPDLMFASIDDTVAGDLMDGANYDTSDCGSSLGYGESCTIEYSYVVQEGDPDPFENTIEVHANPNGFPNDISDRASADVDLLHPSFIVTKDCLEEPVPAGSSAYFQVYVKNTGDVALNFATDEDDIGDFSLEPGGEATFEVSRLAENGMTEVINEVNVTATLPEQYGLDNVLTGHAEDACDVNGGATRTPGFWQTHLDYTEHVLLQHLGGTIDLGWKQLDSIGDVMGMFWANNARDSQGNRRDKVCQARVTVSFQALAAILNSGLDNGAPLPVTIEQIQDTLSGTDWKAMRALGEVLADYNQSGDDVGIIDEDGHEIVRANPNGSRDVANYEIADCD